MNAAARGRFRGRLSLVLMLLLMVVTLCTAPAHAQATQPGTGGSGALFVAGTADSLFLLAAGSDPQTPNAAIVLQRSRDTGGWEPLAEMVGTARDISPWRSGLAVMLDTGTWRSVYRGGSTL